MEIKAFKTKKDKSRKDWNIEPKKCFLLMTVFIIGLVFWHYELKKSGR